MINQKKNKQVIKPGNTVYQEDPESNQISKISEPLTNSELLS